MANERRVTIGDRTYRGMIDDPTGPIPEGFVALAENYFNDNGRYRPRQGMVKAGAALPTPVQALMWWQSRADQTRYTMAVAGGKLWLYDWALDQWDEVAMTASDPELDAAADVDWVQFKDWLVLTDGVNPPFTWDGTIFSALTNAPIATGVTVYYLKLFFYGLPTEPSTFYWSEEGMPNEGYLGPKPGGGIYDNVWDFGQTDMGPIVKMVGTNERLIVMKRDSIAAVSGAVEPDFRTTGQREGIDDEIGIRAKDSALIVGGDVYYHAPDSPKVIAAGVGQPVDASQSRVEETWRRLQTSAVGRTVSAFDARRNHIVWFVPRFTTDRNDWAIVHALGESRDPTAEEGMSFFTGWDVVKAAAVTDDAGEPWVMFADHEGQVYKYGPDGVWSDDGAAISRRIWSRGLGAETPTVYKNIDKVMVETEIERSTSGMQMIVEADNRPQPPVEITVENRSLLWSMAWGTAWGDRAPARAVAGVLLEGRRIRYRFEQETDEEVPPLLGVTLTGTAAGTVEY